MNFLASIFVPQLTTDTYYGLKDGTFVHPVRATTAWPRDTYSVYLNECLWTSWDVLKAYLESKLQV